LDDAAAGRRRAACQALQLTTLADTYAAGSRLHHTTPDLGLSSETQSDNGIDVDDLPPQVRSGNLRNFPSLGDIFAFNFVFVVCVALFIGFRSMTMMRS
jgi:hypothetical protein